MRVMTERLDILDIVRRAFLLCAECPKLFEIFALTAVWNLAFNIGEKAGLFTEDVGALLLIAVLAAQYYFQAVGFHAVGVASAGDHPNLSESMRLGGPRFIPFLLTFLLFALGTGVGLFLLIIPGLIILAMWFVAPAAAVLEGTGPLDSLERSFHLTAGNRFEVFGIIVTSHVPVALAVLPMMAYMTPNGAVPWSVLIFSFVLSTAYSAFYAAVTVLTYQRLQALKEGVRA